MISVFRNLNKFSGKSKYLDGFAIFCARFLPFLMAGFLAIYFIWYKEGLVAIAVLLSGFFSRFVINETVYVFHRAKRPAQFEGSKVLIPVPKYPSFPSGHASFFFGMSFALLFYNIWLAIIFIGLSFIMGISRVFCGVHWFKDIVAGMLAGLVSSLIIAFGIDFWQKL